MALEGRETLHYGKGTLKVELKAKEENLMGQETKHEHRVPLASTISDYWTSQFKGEIYNVKNEVMDMGNT